MSVDPEGSGEPLEPVPEPGEIDEQAAMRLFDRTVDRQYRTMLDAELENTEDE